MKTITLYLKMHREACLYAGSLADGPKYDGMIDDYCTWLAEHAAKAGFRLVCSNRPAKRIYKVEDDDEAAHRFMRDDQYAFWHWYFATTPLMQDPDKTVA